LNNNLCIELYLKIDDMIKIYLSIGWENIDILLELDRDKKSPIFMEGRDD
jgi:hypothetical protein